MNVVADLGWDLYVVQKVMDQLVGYTAKGVLQINEGHSQGQVIDLGIVENGIYCVYVFEGTVHSREESFLCR